MAFIALCEFLGGIGIILPALTGILPWLTLWATTGLALIMLLAAVFHLVRREYANIVFNLVLLVLAAFVAYGRFFIIPF
ncbi:MAG TPA: DoxX family protein [Anaerolineales bacterium]